MNTPDSPDSPETPPPGEEPQAAPPPPPPPPAAGPPPSAYGPAMMNWPVGARMPVPGNAEWALWLVVEILFAIIWAASDAVDAGSFTQLTAIITFAYLISRGIAKASRVLEQ
jgi:hypothetical protein